MHFAKVRPLPARGGGAHKSANYKVLKSRAGRFYVSVYYPPGVHAGVAVGWGGAYRPAGAARGRATYLIYAPSAYNRAPSAESAAVGDGVPRPPTPNRYRTQPTTNHPPSNPYRSPVRGPVPTRHRDGPRLPIPHSPRIILQSATLLLKKSRERNVAIIGRGVRSSSCIDVASWLVRSIPVWSLRSPWFGSRARGTACLGRASPPAAPGLVQGGAAAWIPRDKPECGI